MPQWRRTIGILMLVAPVMVALVLVMNAVPFGSPYQWVFDVAAAGFVLIAAVLFIWFIVAYFKVAIRLIKSRQ